MRAKVALWLLWLAFFVSARLYCCGGQLEGGGKKRGERGLKWGIGAYGERQRGAGWVFGLYVAVHGACGGCLTGCSSMVAQNGV